jgi:hypothetical protein
VYTHVFCRAIDAFRELGHLGFWGVADEYHAAGVGSPDTMVAVVAGWGYETPPRYFSRARRRGAVLVEHGSLAEAIIGMKWLDAYQRKALVLPGREWVRFQRAVGLGVANEPRSR